MHLWRIAQKQSCYFDRAASFRQYDGVQRLVRSFSASGDPPSDMGGIPVDLPSQLAVGTLRNIHQCVKSLSKHSDPSAFLSKYGAGASTFLAYFVPEFWHVIFTGLIVLRFSCKVGSDRVVRRVVQRRSGSRI